jgi:hypothetical protein
MVVHKSWQVKGGRNGTSLCKLSLFRRHLKAYASPTTRGTVAHAQTKRRRDQIEPRENAEGAGENLGLDDIPQV